ncbi:MAG: endonuclease III [Flavobacteriales bacterium]|nr:endonuclease III [Flavobacteriales bacterium]|tara:strand:+ start:33 stop:677 length:645 start_codon:yes stop_codon:yes gene_type:complete
MRKYEKVKYVIQSLEDLYPNPPIPLNSSNDFTLLIAVLLSAQCTDERVNKVTPTLFSRADNPYDMVKLSISEIEDIIRSCGLSPSKSKNIYNLSNILIHKYQGDVPKKIDKLEELPGVGHKTASVIMSQAFNVPAFPVDTHIHRMMYRWGFSNGVNVQKTEKDAMKIFPKNLWNKLHLQIIFYAREYSPARGYELNKDFITKNIGRKSFINNYL